METVSNKNYKRVLVLAGGGCMGAYQAGVIKYLEDIEWSPDLVCGNSVGALNAAGLASGKTGSEILEIWKGAKRKNIYRVNPLRVLRQLLFKQKENTPISLFDSSPLEKTIEKHIDFANFRNSMLDMFIMATNVATSQLHVFSKEEIQVKHLMASMAIPLLFPWQYIDGNAYWDGGSILNVPLLPALQYKCNKIIVVTTVSSGMSYKKQMGKMPENINEVISKTFAQLASSSFQVLRDVYGTNSSQKSMKNSLYSWLDFFTENKPDIHILHPNQQLYEKNNFNFMNFNKKQIDSLLESGYNDAKEQIPDFLASSSSSMTQKVLTQEENGQ